MSPSRATALTVLLAAAPAGASLLDVDPSPRSAARGSASTAEAGNAWGMFSNPAGLAAVPSRRLLLGETSGSGGGDLQSAGLVLPFRRFTAGAGAARLSWGDFDGRDAEGRPLGRFRAEETAAVLSLSTGKNGAAVGASFKLLRERVGAAAASVALADVGLSAGGLAPFSWGLALQNFRPGGPETSLSAGVSLRTAGPGAFSVDARRLAGGASAVGVGWERRFAGSFALRAGYAPVRAGGAAWRAGLGIRRGAATLDYAVVPLGDAGLAQSLSLEQLF